MFTVNGAPYFQIDTLLSESDAKILDEEISWGLSLVGETYHCDGSEYSRGDAELSLYDKQFKDAEISKNELTLKEKEKFSLLTFPQKQRFLKIAKKAYLPWGTCYSLNNISSWSKKMDPSNKIYTPEAQKFFPKLIEWCHSLPVFKDIGRIEIFGVDACQHVTCHRDQNPAIWPIKDQFLMLSPREDKRFYIFDEISKEKIFVKSKLFTFDDLQYHGVDAAPFFTYSVRIDGPFNREYEQKIIYDRFVKNNSAHI